MKKVLGILLAAMTLLIPFCTIVSATDVKGEKYSFFISIYDDINRVYLLENTKIAADTNTTVLQSLKLLKDKKLVSDYDASQNEVAKISVGNMALQSTPPPDQFMFYVKLNGSIIKSDDFSKAISDGDIVEWIYSTSDKMIAEVESNTDTTSTTNKLPAIEWTQETQKIMLSGCDYLDLNKEQSSMYIVSMGCAGRVADMVVVNTLLSDVRQATSYGTSINISKTILLLTFAGYDASDIISELVVYENINKQGLFGSINALVAYDSKDYPVDESAVNSREALVDNIVLSQRDTGGFGISEGSKDDLDTTAMAITALSPYMSDAEVKAAIDKAVQFLIDNQTKTGGFGFMGQESSESLSQVIIALSSVGIQANDERFVKKGKTLLDNLLEYRNKDGGFSHIKGSTSSVIPTEQAVIALSSLKKNDNPYKTTGIIAQKNDTSSEQKVELQKNEYVNLNIGIAILTAIFAILVVIYAVHKKRRV